MSTLLRSIQIPLFIKVEPSILSTIAQVLEEQHLQFERIVVLSEQHILDLGGQAVVDALPGCTVLLYSKNTIADGDRIADELRTTQTDLLVSIGGGRIVDLGKYAATKAHISYISAPTSPSNDGISSPIAVMEDDAGVTHSLGVDMPIGILVDTALMSSAPDVNVQSGIGELISNFSAIADWKLAYRDGKEPMDDFAASISFSAAQLIYETCRGVSITLHDSLFLGKLVNGLILSGIAMNVAGSSRPCSGAEHEISHAIDALYPGRSLHGLQVAFGTLLMDFLRGESIDHFIDFFRSVGLPITIEELGFTRQELHAVIQHAPQTRPDRYTILEKKNLSAEDAQQLITDYHSYVEQYTS